MCGNLAWDIPSCKRQMPGSSWHHFNRMNSFVRTLHPSIVYTTPKKVAICWKTSSSIFSSCSSDVKTEWNCCHDRNSWLWCANQTPVWGLLSYLPSGDKLAWPMGRLDFCIYLESCKICILCSTPQGYSEKFGKVSQERLSVGVGRQNIWIWTLKYSLYLQQKVDSSGIVFLQPQDCFDERSKRFQQRCQTGRGRGARPIDLL